MQLETALNRLIKYLNRRTEELSAALTSGGIDSMEKYRYIIGQISALEAVKQESLLKSDIWSFSSPESLILPQLLTCNARQRIELMLAPLSEQFRREALQ